MGQILNSMMRTSQSNQQVVLWRLLRLTLAGVMENTCFPSPHADSPPGDLV
jgi:hypothetical protein